MIAGVVLGLLGFVANWFKLDLFFNVDLLFGSIFVMLAILRYGTAAGIIAGTIAASCTYLIWGHPWAVVIFIGEALFVGWKNRNHPNNVIVSDILYWLCCGVPLGLVLYHQLLGVPAQITLLVVLKQSLNGVSNALLAVLATMVGQACGRGKGSLYSFRQLVFVMMVSLVLIPTFVLFVIHQKSDIQSDRERQVEKARRTALLTRSSLDNWVHEQHLNIITLARLIGDPGAVSVEHIRRHTEVMKAMSPSLKWVGVLDRNAVTIAYSPLVDEKSSSTLGRNYSDRPYIAQLKESKKPLVGELVMSRFGTPHAILPLLAPLVVSNRYCGYCIGMVDPTSMRELLTTIVGKQNMQVTLLDGNGRIIVSTRPELKTMEVFPANPGWKVLPEANKVCLWTSPPLPGTNGMTKRWQPSLLVAEELLAPDIGWTVRVELPMQPLLGNIGSETVSALLFLSLMVLASIFLSDIFSKKVVNSLQQLKYATQALPAEFCLEMVTKKYPESRILEVDGLIANYRQMAYAVYIAFSQLKIMNETLERRVEERTEELARSEARFKGIVETAPAGVFESDIEGSCTYVSGKWLEITGLTESSAMGNGWTDIIHPDDKQLFLAEKNLAIKELRPFRMEFRLIRPDGQLIWVLGQAVILPSGCRRIGTITDITPLKLREALAEELEEKKIRMSIMEKEKRHLREKEMLVKDLHDGIGGIVVNLTMLGQYGLMQTKNGPCRCSETFNKIIDLASEGGSEIRSFMNSLESGESAWSDLLAEIKDYSEKMLAPYDISLVVSALITEGLPAIGLFRYVNIVRICREIIANVIKHAHASTVTLVFSAAEERFEVSIADDGVGYNSDTVKRRGLANMFSRALEIGADLSGTSSSAGSTVILTLPLAGRES
jgi:PAS domain S-box-containing protein